MSFLPKDKYQIKEAFATAAMIGVGYALIPESPDLINNLDVAAGFALQMTAYPLVLRKIKERAKNSRTEWDAGDIPKEIQALAEKAGVKKLNILFHEDGTGIQPITHDLYLNETDFHADLSPLNEGEKLGIAAHEIGHILNRDKQKDLLRLAFSILSLDTTLLTQSPTALGVLLFASTYVCTQKFISRQREYAADKKGAELLGSTTHQITHFQKLENEEQEYLNQFHPLMRILEKGIESILSTHPTHKQRIRALESLKLNND